MQDMHIVWANWDNLSEKAQANANIHIVVCEMEILTNNGLLSIE
jgi:hypothetical protein